MTRAPWTAWRGTWTGPAWCGPGEDERQACDGFEERRVPAERPFSRMPSPWHVQQPEEEVPMTARHIRRIAALGSSYAAGPGIEPVADRRAHRSARNYPQLLAERLGAALTDLTVSGATTETITS